MFFQNKTAQTNVMPLSILSLTVDSKVIHKENNNQVIIQGMVAGWSQPLTFSMPFLQEPCLELDNYFSLHGKKFLFMKGHFSFFWLVRE